MWKINTRGTQTRTYTEEDQTPEVLDRETLLGTDIVTCGFDDMTHDERDDALMEHRPHCVQLG